MHAAFGTGSETVVPKKLRTSGIFFGAALVDECSNVTGIAAFGIDGSTLIGVIAEAGALLGGATTIWGATSWLDEAASGPRVRVTLSVRTVWRCAGGVDGAVGAGGSKLGAYVNNARAPSDILC